MSTFTREQVAEHNSASSAWIIIDSVVYDITKFAPMHPGGEAIILALAGKDATHAFYSFHRQEVLFKYDRLKIGTLVNESPKIILNTPGLISTVPYGEPSFWQGYLI